MVPLFRRLAEHYYRLQMVRGLGQSSRLGTARLIGSFWCLCVQRKQEQQLAEYLAGAHGFADTHKDDRYEAVARALTQATLQLSLLAKVWQVRGPVFAPPVFARPTLILALSGPRLHSRR